MFNRKIKSLIALFILLAFIAIPLSGIAVLKPLYGNKTAVTITGYNSLTNGSVATSDAIDNSSNLYQEFLIEVTAAGTAASTAWLDVRLLVSEDNSTFSTWESAIKLGAIDLSVTPQAAHFSTLNSLYQAPKYFKVAIKNATGASLSSSGNAVSYQGIQIQNL